MKDVGHLDVCLLGRFVSHCHAGHLICFSKELEQKNATRRQASGSNVTSTTQSMEMYTKRRESMHSKVKALAKTMKNEEAEDPIK